MADAVAIGIDLGTSNSCVAVTRGRQVDVLPNAYGESVTASVVHFRQDGTIIVGNAAKAQVIHDPKYTVSSAKRLIGRYFFSEEVKKAQAVCSYRIVEGQNHSVRIQVRDEQFALPEISAMVLREMKSIAEERLGHAVRQAVITVPAYFNDNQRQATRDAGRIAGLEVLRLLNEPTAAALAYGFGRGLNQRVAVYDLGGGTFDVSILEIGKDVFEVLSTCGDTYLGGDDLDDRLIDLLADEFVAREGINLRNDPYCLEKLKLAAETAKKTLSVDDSVEIVIPEICTGADGEPRSIQRTITTSEYGVLINDLVLRTFKVCDEALQQANVIARDLDGVILVGGPTRLPIIREAVRQYFQQEPKSDVNPDEVVAMGAAIHAASLVAPSQPSYLLDVTPLSLRIGVAGGLAEPVIDRNTPVPIEQTRAFTTVQDNQERVKIRVYQGESRKADENELLGQFEFSGFKKAARGEVRIDVTFEINGDGIVNVTARDRETGQQASTEILLSSGLTKEEMAEILKRQRTDRVQTAKLGEPEAGAGASSGVARAAAAAPASAAAAGGRGAAPKSAARAAVTGAAGAARARAAVAPPGAGAGAAPARPAAASAAPGGRAPAPAAARPAAAAAAPASDIARPATSLDEDDLDVLPDENDVEALLGEADLDLAPGDLDLAPGDLDLAPGDLDVAGDDLDFSADPGADLPADASAPRSALLTDEDLVGSTSLPDAYEAPSLLGGSAPELGPEDILPEVEEEMIIERPREMRSTPLAKPSAPPAAPAARAPAPAAAAAPADAPAYEAEIELDPSDLGDLVDLDLAEAPEFDADAPPQIGGAADFSEGDFPGAGRSDDEDPNAKTQPDLAAASLPSAAQAPAAGRPAGAKAVATGAPASAAGAPADDPELFGDAGADLSLFDDDDDGGL